MEGRAQPQQSLRWRMRGLWEGAGGWWSCQGQGEGEPLKGHWLWVWVGDPLKVEKTSASNCRREPRAPQLYRWWVKSAGRQLRRVKGKPAVGGGREWRVSGSHKSKERVFWTFLQKHGQRTAGPPRLCPAESSSACGVSILLRFLKASVLPDSGAVSPSRGLVLQFSERSSPISGGLSRTCSPIWS